MALNCVIARALSLTRIVFRSYYHVESHPGPSILVCLSQGLFRMFVISFWWKFIQLAQKFNLCHNVACVRYGCWVPDGTLQVLQVENLPVCSSFLCTHRQTKHCQGNGMRLLSIPISFCWCCLIKTSLNPKNCEIYSELGNLLFQVWLVEITSHRCVSLFIWVIHITSCLGFYQLRDANLRICLRQKLFLYELPKSRFTLGLF